MGLTVAKRFAILYTQAKLTTCRNKKAMKIRIPEKVKSVLKFEAKLLVGVAVLGAVIYFGAGALIAKAAEMVANAYTQGF